MRRAMRPDGLDLDPGMSVRSRSISSEKPSLSGSSIMSLPPRASPEPAYIAASAASQLVSSEFDDEGMMVSQPALALLNLFLDHVLFNILSTARATRLGLLRHAVPEVLKPRLGREAVAGADEELREYLGGDEDEEELSEWDDDPGHGENFDLELAWKLARLRCMVYTRLGDLEEDDEDEFIEQQHLEDRRGSQAQYAGHSSSVTPAAAIFLTSILEYLGEQALYYAGEAAQRRILSSHGQPSPITSLPVRKVLEEIDMFQVGRDSPLQRLWRTWRRNVRSPTRPLFSESAFHRTEPLTAGSSRKDSLSTTSDPYDHEVPIPLSVAQVLHASESVHSPTTSSRKWADELGFRGAGGQSNGIRTPDRATSPLKGEIESLGPTRLLQMQAMADGQPASVTRPYNGTVLSRARSRSLPPSTKRGAEGQIEPIFETYSGEESGVEEPDRFVDHAVQQDGRGLFDTKASDTARNTMMARTASVRSDKKAEEEYPNRKDEQEETSTPERPITTVHISNRTSAGHAASAKDGNARLSQVADAHLLTTTNPGDEASNDPDRNETSVQEDMAQYGELNHQATQNRNSLKSSAPTSLVSVRDQALVLAPLRFTPDSTDDHDQSGAQPLTPAPPLTPLREMMEEARSTSDEASSKAPSTRGQSNLLGGTESTEDTAVKHSRNSASLSSQSSRRSSSSSKLVGFTRGKQGASDASVLVNAAGVQGAAHDFAYSQPQELQPHEAVTFRPSTEIAQLSPQNQPFWIRASTTENPKLPGKRHNHEGEKGRQSLENLLMSDRTLHYTLTPENMRTVESPLLRSARSHEDEQVRPLTSHSTASGKGVNNLRQQPPEIASKNVVSSPKLTPTPTIPRSAAAVAALTPSKSKPNNAQPRDPRVDAHTTRDLADYAKSTGPESEEQLPPMLSTRVGKSVTAKGPPSSPQQRGKPGSISTSGSSQKSGPKRTQARIEPREARGLRSDTTSALIDLIREGPPRDAGQHRIPRELAPFRTTMDSDDLKALGPLPDTEQIGGSSVATTLESSVASKSFPSSSNSRTGLVERPGNSSQPYKPSSESMATPDASRGMMPKRKQRRVRDPYALDLDDEDEAAEVIAPLHRKGRREEESLVDFLRNTSPPPESKAQPIMAMPQSNVIEGDVQKKTSNPSMRDRLMRNTSVNGMNRTGISKRSDPDLKRDKSLARVRLTNNARAESPHLSQTGSKLDSYRPTKTTYAAHTDRNRHKSRAAMQMDASQTGVGTSDKTDLAKSKEPRTPLDGTSPDVSNDEAGFAKFFSRKKKVPS